jgi:hypothetical protein
MRLTRRQAIIWSAVILVMIGVGATAILVGARIGAQKQHRAIFTIHEITPGPHGTTTLKYDLEVFGNNVVAGVAEKTGSKASLLCAFTSANLAEMLGFPAGRKWIGNETSCAIGDCRAPPTIKAPLTIELKPDEQFVLATCRDATGATVELFVYCDY